MRRVRLKKRYVVNRFYIFVITFFLAILCAITTVIHISDRITPMLIDLADIKLNKFSTAIVNNAISQVLDDKIETLDMVEIVKNDDGEIQLIDFNPASVNHILNVATTVVQNNIRILESGDIKSVGLYNLNLTEEELYNIEEGIVVAVPLGSALGITLFANLGPKIAVRYSYIGDVNSNISTKITQYGMNNALLEIGVHLEMTAQVYLPFTTEVKVIECDIPLVIKVIQGSIPNYYSGILTKDSSIYTSPNS